MSRLRSLHDLRDIDAGLSIHLGKAGRIADQATGDDVLTEVVHRCDPETICQRDDLVAAGLKERIQREGSDPLPGKFSECRVNFSLGTCVQDHEFHAQSRRGLLRIRYLGLKARTRWIGKEAK